MSEKNIKEPTKPISVVRNDFCQSLLELINTSGLPPFVIQPILGDFQRMINNAVEEQFKKESEQYQKELNEYNKSKKGNGDN